MVLTDIPEMVEDLKSGELTFATADSCLVWMISDHEVQEIYDALPKELQLRFSEVLRQTFGTNGPPGNIILLNSATGDHPQKLKVVDRARSWLQAHGLMHYGVYAPREKAPRSIQAASAEFWAKHFPPRPLTGSQAELIRRCAALEREAHSLAEQRNDLAVLLYQQASAVQLRVAEAAPEPFDPQRPKDLSRSVHLMHAYSLQLSSGEVFQARKLMEHVHGDLSTLPDFAELIEREEEALFCSDQLERALSTDDWELVNEAAATAWGKVSPERILDALLQLAERNAREEEVQELLQRLAIAYPQNESYRQRCMRRLRDAERTS